MAVFQLWKCPGNPGGIDMNECYQDYPKTIKGNGPNGFSAPTPGPTPTPEPVKR